MNTRGAYDFGRKALYYIIVAIALSFIFFYMSSVIRNYNDSVVADTQRIEGAIIAAEAVMSPKCFAYQDTETGRVYPGIIDMGKFNSNSFGKSCFPYIQSSYSFALKGNVLKGGGSEVPEKVNIPVLIISGNKLEPGIMNVGLEDYYIQKGQKTASEGAAYYTA